MNRQKLLDCLHLKLNTLIHQYRDPQLAELERLRVIKKLMFVELRLRQVWGDVQGFCLKCKKPISPPDLENNPDIPFCEKHRRSIEDEFRGKDGTRFARLIRLTRQTALLALSDLLWENLPEIELPPLPKETQGA